MSFSLSAFICSLVTVFWKLFVCNFFSIFSGIGNRLVSDNDDDDDDKDGDNDDIDDDDNDGMMIKIMIMMTVMIKLITILMKMMMIDCFVVTVTYNIWLTDLLMS